MRTRSEDEATLDRQIEQARARAARHRKSEPHANGVRYLKQHRRLRICLTNDAVLELPVDSIVSLRGASDAVLSHVTVGAAGLSLRWESLDEDLGIAALVELLVGKRILMSASGRAGGASRTAAKIRASRANGRKGGRPRGVVK